VAVKKASAKKPAKKAVAKKSVAKKAAAKPVKKATAKKAPAKKVAKKSVVKPAAKKAVAKKPAAKKAAAKKPVKKTATKKSAVKKSASKKQVLKFDIPEAPVVARPSRVEVVSTPAPAPVIAPITTKPAPKTSGPSSRVIFAVAVGIIILVAIVWGKSGKNSDEDAVKPSTSTTMTADPSTSATPDETSASPAASASETTTTSPAAVAAHEAPQAIVAHYTKAGATIFWNAPSATDGLTGYNVEISVGGGVWKTISTLPATQMTQDVTKNSSDSWTSFRVSSVYSDSVTTPGKVFGLPGTFS